MDFFKSDGARTGLLANSQNESPWSIIGEHLGIAILVVVLSHFIGISVAKTFA